MNDKTMFTHKEREIVDPNSLTRVQSKEDIHNRHVAFYFNYPLGSPPLELHISAVKDMLNRENEVTIYLCKGQLKSCTANPFRAESICRFCKYRTETGLNTIEGSLNIKTLQLDETTSCVKETVIPALELGVMSSLASAVKAQSYEQLNGRWKKVHNKMLESSYLLYSFFVKEVELNNYDYLFMFNGRFGDVKPVLEAARSANIGYGLYEVKKSLHEVVFVNELVHSIEANTRRAISAYAQDPIKAKENASIFFGKKQKKQDTGDPVYTINQQQGKLPDAVQTSEAIIVAVYPTTDDEYKFIGKEWDGYVPDDQVEEIDQLAKSLDNGNYLIVVKMHPNQATTAENIIDRYLDLEVKYKHVVVEEPLSKKDTYALMHRADYIVNFASTIGVEACYARKIVVAIGDTTFSKMNIAHKTQSGKEAGELILEGGLKPKSIRGAVIWGNYLMTYADQLTAFSRVKNGDYRVDGQKIGHSKLLRLLQIPSKLNLEISKPGFKLNLSFILKAKHTVMNIIQGKWAVK